MINSVTHENNSVKSGNFWSHQVDTDGKLSVCFATAFRFANYLNLTSTAKNLPEGTVICNPRLIAGLEHVEAVLLQTREYWKRDERLARNGSIEILMRISCSSQISEALEASALNNVNKIALLGLTSSLKEADRIVKRFQSEPYLAVASPDLLGVDERKAIWLKKFHGLPQNLSDNQLRVALQERSVLLIFSS